jgi:hypothetical protein
VRIKISVCGALLNEAEATEKKPSRSRGFEVTRTMVEKKTPPRSLVCSIFGIQCTPTATHDIEPEHFHF